MWFAWRCVRVVFTRVCSPSEQKVALAHKDSLDVPIDKALADMPANGQGVKGQLLRRLGLRVGKIGLQVGRAFIIFRKPCPDALTMVFASDCFAVLVDVIVAIAAYVRSSSPVTPAPAAGSPPAGPTPAASLSGNLQQNRPAQPPSSGQPTMRTAPRAAWAAPPAPAQPAPSSAQSNRTNFLIGIPYVMKGVLSISFNAAAQIWITQSEGDTEPGVGYQYNPFKIVKVYAEGLTNIGKGLYFLKKGRNPKIEVALIASYVAMSGINSSQIYLMTGLMTGLLPGDLGEDVALFETHNGEPTDLNR
mmetsp:Transcript_31619/g.74196  ORF Transcript_31619/g.74196 Transcript_31619/m.74196 type:complete len:304 (+) Transcript_31619:145-1056(+)